MPRLKIHFDFGWHVFKGDANGLRDRSSGFKTQVYVREDYSLSEQTRPDMVRNMNYVLEKARKGSVTGRQLIEMIAKGTNQREMRMSEFGHEEFAAITALYRAHMFFLETHRLAKQIRSGVENVERLEREAVGRVLRLDTDGAIRCLLENARESAEMYSVRERNIIENLPGLLPALIGSFPRLAGMDEVRVFVRYGIAHTAIYDGAVQLGIDATRHYREEDESICNAMIIRPLMTDPAIAVSDDLVLRAVIESAIMSAIVTALKNARQLGIEAPGEISMGRAIRMARGFMHEKPTQELLEVFTEGRNLGMEDAIRTLVYRPEISQLWSHTTE